MEKKAVAFGVLIQQARDRDDEEMIRACNACTIPWKDCPATADCPHLQDLLAHPLTGCDPVNND